MKFMSGYSAAARPTSAHRPNSSGIEEEQTLMDANIAHAELARPFDEGYANLGAVEFESMPSGPHCV